ncbi:LysR family transcriptional regulator [Gilliamella sp. wkB108]|uniref:LysR family transcriptional regulator n=1 Tax=Gilliamella sp. wkB108 TaxID=3120256 RepID=UPI00080EADC8|nr:LysR family transcriptional regulator [Gilliamella apicola]OCG22181.1 LysR family transcriptional regulator [Gilliamella apicola]
MDIRVLRYFLAVANEGSITAAANALYLTQPTLSRQLKELEDELGKKLFHRSNHRISLTEEGVLLRKRANEILDLVNKTKAEFVDIKENITGNIHIGCGETEVFRYIAQITKEIQEQYPHIHFHFYSGNAEYVMEKLDKGLFDFGIVIEPVNVSNYYYLNMPNNDTWGLLMRKDSPLATFNMITVSHLANLPLICSRQLLIESLSKNNVINWLGDMATKLNIVATYNLIFNASILVREGVGYAITLDKLANTSDESPICFRPFAPKLESGLNIIWKKDQVLSNASKLFLEKIKEVCEFS